MNHVKDTNRTLIEAIPKLLNWVVNLFKYPLQVWRDEDCIIVRFVRSSENPRNCSVPHFLETGIGLTLLL
ncbi:hypothetical protein CsatB_007196 [Cannabis sativa]